MSSNRIKLLELELKLAKLKECSCNDFDYENKCKECGVVFDEHPDGFPKGKVQVKVLYAKIDYYSERNDYGTDTDCVRATCPNCLQSTESYGDGDSSIKRCLVLLQQQCGCAEFFGASSK